MVNAKLCVDALFDVKTGIDDKARSFAEYLDWHSTLGSRVGVGARLGREVAIQSLFEQLRPSDAVAHAQLRAVLDQIRDYYREQREAAKAQAAAARHELKSLPPGTLILIKDPHFPQPVALVEMRRTRFVIEDADGCRYSVPARAFVRALAECVPLISEEERVRRETVRALAGRDFSHARERILAAGLDMLTPMLAEMDAAHRRIENAPIGMSKGLLAASLGPGRIVSPLDEALLKRIPRIVSELAETVGVETVRSNLCKWSNRVTIQAVETELERTESKGGNAKRGHAEPSQPADDER